ncbi:hypothetical protein [Burkholderia cepacia]|uniref:hypothetical protein n=1 Tax=Burkholderia cepacia TaxID=292 RepID=UPI00114679A6|nr:hypothetical protein [Burkholderia cepacia]
MSTPAEQQAAQDIGNVRIDPAAEPTTAPAAGSATPQDEAAFYKRSGDEYRLKHNQQNLGWLGIVFGSNSSAPTNIVGLVVLASFVFIAVSFFVPNSSDLGTIRTGLISLVSTAVGYIFGSTKKDS